MSDPFIGEIRMFGGNFAPVGWAFCDGSLVPISENDVLFALIGTTYGGNGTTNFGLPDLRGRVPIHAGNGHVLGEKAGVESVTLAANTTPIHSHAVFASTDQAAGASPANNVIGTTSANIYHSPAANHNFAASAVTAAGGSQPHDNMQPYAVVSFIISLVGTFPSEDH